MPPAAHPWRWIPTLYFGQGLPYVVVTTLAVVMYKNLGVSNADIALVTSWLYLPWVVKPLWSPLVDLVGRKRTWIVALQCAIGAALALLALALPGPRFLQATLAVLWLLAFASATHDIAADGFYMLALPDPRRQSAFVGVRSLFYRLAMLTGQGALVWWAGALLERRGAAGAWAVVMAALGGAFALLALYHAVVLPRPAGDLAPPPPRRAGAWWREFVAVFAAFFRRDDIVRVLAFLLLYRFAEAQLLRLAAPFLLDAPAAGGLGLSTQALGLAYGTVGVIALSAGGLLGGWFAARVGLARALWPLVFAMHVPNVLYVALAASPPQALAAVGAVVAVEQFGYGFGFTAYMVYLLHVAAGPRGDNPHRTAHYAIGTGFMALGMMLPGLGAGWLQERIGYVAFFAWCCIATLPSFAVAAWIRRGLGERA